MGHIGPILGPSRAFPGPSRPSLRNICRSKFCVTQNLPKQILRNAKFAKAKFAHGPILCHLEAILGPSWCHLEAILCQFGGTLGYLEAILGLFRAFLGYFTSTFCPAGLSQNFQNLCFVDAKCLFLESSYLGCVQNYFWSILGAILGYLGLS